MQIKNLATAAALALFAGMANAATVDITLSRVAGDDIAAGNNAVLAFLGGSASIFESFEGPTGVRNPTTSVGTFVGAGSLGAGTSAVDCGEGVGNGACVKPHGTGTVSGRYATDGTNWLDSNDMNEIVWTIPGTNGAPGLAVSAIAFLLTDIDDVGSFRFQINAGGDAVGSALNNVSGGEDDGSLHLVTMLFSAPVTNLIITMENGNGDGFGVDSIGMNVVPLPAAGWMLLAGLGGLVALKRREKAAA